MFSMRLMVSAAVLAVFLVGCASSSSEGAAGTDTVFDASAVPDEGVCEPDCEGRECGPDGCGGSCGVCDVGGICYAGLCCEPSCGDRECGPDGCGGACGTCPEGDVCLAGSCCSPDCRGRDCGPDGCGGACGDCGEEAVCLNGMCCAPTCQSRECGPDGCGGNCGTCALPRFCDYGICVFPDADDDGIPDTADPFPLDINRPGEARDGVVYGHSATALYRIDLKTYQAEHACDFNGLVGDTAGEKRMTDLAIDAYGVVWGVSYLRLYTCHPESCACWLMVDMADVLDDEGIYEINALTLIPGELFDEPRDVLVGVSNDGGWHRFDVDYERHEIQVTRLGSYGHGFRSSGDAYSIAGIGTFAAVDTSGTSGDLIVAVEPTTGAADAAPIAELPSYGSVFGLAGWTEHAFAFDRGGTVVVVNLDERRILSTLVHRQLGSDVSLCVVDGEEVSTSDTVCRDGDEIAWWGAGVRTRVEE